MLAKLGKTGKMGRGGGAKTGWEEMGGKHGRMGGNHTLTSPRPYIYQDHKPLPLKLETSPK